MENNESKVVLKVEDLSMYFKMGSHTLKAVDHVNFEIHEGEVFGLVGESGCGKTTTGRTIIKLYNATGGNVYFKGQRIVAGIGDYKETIKNCKEKLKDKSLSAEEVQELNEKISEAKRQISLAKYDNKNCNNEYIEKCSNEAKEKYQFDLYNQKIIRMKKRDENGNYSGYMPLLLDVQKFECNYNQLTNELIIEIQLHDRKYRERFSI